MSNRISHSRLAVLQDCQRLHWIRYGARYEAITTSETRDFGKLMHRGLEYWWRAYQFGLGGSALEQAIAALRSYGADDVSLAKAEVLMTAYDARWAPAMVDYEVLAVEAEFKTALDDGNEVVGVLDALVRRLEDGRLLIVEHKTSGADIGPTANYWRKLRMEPQVSMYYRGARALGYEPDGCLWDVLARPDIRPLQATPVDKRKYTKAGALYANQRAEDETLDEFKERLVAAIAESPEAYFARADVVRTEQELERFEDDVVELSRQALAATEKAPRNPSACFGYGRACEFLEVCDGTGSLDDDTKYRKRDEPEGGGRP